MNQQKKKKKMFAEILDISSEKQFWVSIDNNQDENCHETSKAFHGSKCTEANFDDWMRQGFVSIFVNLQWDS